MTFKDNVRIELIYFENLKKQIRALNTWKETETSEKLSDILENCIQCDEAIIMLYKNIGEGWNELTGYVAEDKARLEALKAECDAFNTEINEKIDEVNNYLMSRIAELEERLHNLENHVYSSYVEKVLYVEPVSGNGYRIRDFNDETKYYTYDEINDMFYAEQIKPALYYEDNDYIEILHLSCFDGADGDIVFSTVNSAGGGLFHYEIREDANENVRVYKTMIKEW